MIDRVRVPGSPPADRDLGPASGRVHDWARIRKTIDPKPRDEPR